MSKTKDQTKKHIHKVCEVGSIFCHILTKRLMKHDLSKLQEPEVSMFDRYTSKLGEMEYNSPEYKECLEEMKKDALPHHYENNSHHPEHYENGVNDMDLVDLIEMCIDWRSSCERNKNGDYYASLTVNMKRFNILEPLKSLIYGFTKYIYLNYVELYNGDNELVYLCGDDKSFELCFEKMKKFLKEEDYPNLQELIEKYGYYTKVYVKGELLTTK